MLKDFHVTCSWSPAAFRKLSDGHGRNVDVSQRRVKLHHPDISLYSAISMFISAKMFSLFVLICITLQIQRVSSQQIWDIWQTTWDHESLFADVSPQSPINFTSPGAAGAVNIVVDDSSTYHLVWGFGASLTDSSALVLNNLKSTNADSYWKLLQYLFDPTDGANAAGLSYLRVPLGASDFSSQLYSYDDYDSDASLDNFDIHNAPSYLFAIIQDIKSINSALRVHVVPWSPPGWMKDGGTMNGGLLTVDHVNTYANYLLKCLQGFHSRGISVYAISIQNEPQNTDPSYPTCEMPVSTYAQIGMALRTLMEDNGFLNTKLIGYEHNWDDASIYPVDLMDQAQDAFDGVAFHCYAGSVNQQDDFHSRYPTKEIYLTECAGTIGSDWWTDIKWYMDNLFIGSIEYHSHTALMWNIAGDSSGGPKLPGTNSCSNPGCRPVVTVNDNGTYDLNQEFYAMAQASKAIIPKDAGGPWGMKIGVSLGGPSNWTLRVGAYMTGRAKSSDWSRYSLVVLNWDDNSTVSWNPTPVETTIEFHGRQARYTFPVGVTTLWWYASSDGKCVLRGRTQSEHSSRKVRKRFFR